MFTVLVEQLVRFFRIKVYLIGHRVVQHWDLFGIKVVKQTLHSFQLHKSAPILLKEETLGFLKMRLQFSDCNLWEFDSLTGLIPWDDDLDICVLEEKEDYLTGRIRKVLGNLL